MDKPLLNEVLSQVPYIVDFLVNDSETGYFIFEDEVFSTLNQKELITLKTALNNELMKYVSNVTNDTIMFGIHEDAIELYDRYKPFHESGLCLGNLDLKNLPEDIDFEVLINQLMEDFIETNDEETYNLMIEVNKIRNKNCIICGEIDIPEEMTKTDSGYICYNCEND